MGRGVAPPPAPPPPLAQPAWRIALDVGSAPGRLPGLQRGCTGALLTCSAGRKAGAAALRHAGHLGTCRERQLCFNTLQAGMRHPRPRSSPTH